MSSITKPDLMKLVSEIDTLILVRWMAYMRFAWVNPSDKDVQTAAHKFENYNLEELRPLIDALNDLTPNTRPFWPPENL